MTICIAHSGLVFIGLDTQGVALGWYVLPLWGFEILNALKHFYFIPYPLHRSDSSLDTQKPIQHNYRQTPEIPEIH